ncbi:hypothetical protein AYI68_g3152 [Smittium mucronatum]|uniref:Uncharacterized protein n=1 Tax=Smittium mucronatum TaxID=133383 RepID=A0A1R0H0Q4_9FUNG|nr:hypothetical protein AYI68_g3152 [Smittium mucronatum]
MPFLWPIGNPYGWYPLILSSSILLLFSLLVDRDSRKYLFVLYSSFWRGYNLVWNFLYQKLSPYFRLKNFFDSLLLSIKNLQTSRFKENTSLSPSEPEPESSPVSLSTNEESFYSKSKEGLLPIENLTTSSNVQPISFSMNVQEELDSSKLETPKTRESSPTRSCSSLDSSETKIEFLVTQSPSLQKNIESSSSKVSKKAGKPDKIKSKKLKSTKVDSVSPQKSKVNVRFFKYDDSSFLDTSPRPTPPNLTRTNSPQSQPPIEKSIEQDLQEVDNSLFTPKTTIEYEEPMPKSLVETKPMNASAINTLFVCTKCQRSNNNKCEIGYYSCVLEPDYGEYKNVGDIEDLIQPMVSNSTEDGKTKKSGRILYENLTHLLKQQDRIHKLSTVSGVITPSVANHPGPNVCMNSLGNSLQILPVKCLGTCSRGNVIAFRSVNKFAYQFGDLNEVDNEHLEDILEFANMYMDSNDGFSKSKTRPYELRANLLSRIPPLNNNFVNLEF